MRVQNKWSCENFHSQFKRCLLSLKQTQKKDELEQRNKNPNVFHEYNISGSLSLQTQTFLPPLNSQTVKRLAHLLSSALYPAGPYLRPCELNKQKDFRSCAASCLMDARWKASGEGVLFKPSATMACEVRCCTTSMLFRLFSLRHPHPPPTPH